MKVLDWLLRRNREDDLQAEIRAHLSMAAADRVEDGWDREAARLAALKEFGNVTLTRDATRLAWGERWRELVSDLIQDVRYAFRVLRRSPGYSLIVVAVLTLGIGANASLFSVFKGLVLKPLRGVEDSGSLAILAYRSNAGRLASLSHQDFRDIVGQARAFESIAGASDATFRLGAGPKSQALSGEFVTGSYFTTLGIRAQLGRTLLPSDDVAPGAHPVAVISDGLWRRVFGANPGIVGRSVLINGQPMTVVGVAEPEFQGTVVSQVIGLFVPVMMQAMLAPPGRLDNRQQPLLWGIGRLRPGTSIEEASAQADVLSARLARFRPVEQAGERATVVPMWRSPYGAQTNMLPPLLSLGAMGALLLLIVCANVANLVLVRGISRRGEIAARLALGASRGRILRLLSIESLVLAVPAAFTGLWVTRSLMLLVNDAAGTAERPFWIDVSTDGYVAAFAILLACGSALVFGVAPAWRTSGLELASVMKDDLSPRSGSRGRIRSALVVSQVAVSLVLLVGAGLALRSLASVRDADAGVDPRNVAVIDINLQPGGYDEARGAVFFETLLETVRAQPGVEAASLAARLPIRVVEGGASQIAIEGYELRADEDLRAHMNQIASWYFRTLRVGVLAGREFEQQDDRSSPDVAIVNETMARRFWKTPAAAVGKRLRVDGRDWRTVVGVVKDLKYFTLNEPPRPYFYVPFTQMYLPALALHVRATEASPAVLERIQARVQAMDGNLSVPEPLTMTRYFRMQSGIFYIVAIVFAAFGVMALLLAALGTYGLISYSAKQSAHEIGIRIAVGANRSDVLRRFLGNGLRLGAWGGAAGLAVSFAAMRPLATLLYEVSPTDAVAFTAALGAVLFIVLGASSIPAWRASRTDPIAALRHR
jgi:predicted permease